MNKLDKTFNHQQQENKIYDLWIKKDLFNPKKFDNPFSIILPPPNVTGRLHLGHAWDVSLQDTIIRYKKLNGYDVLWVPGTDHAGIATQTKFERIMFEETGKTHYDFTREEFLAKIQIWKDEQANFIHSQWKKMGLALAYDYEKFTMDSDINEIVNKVFVSLYNEGLIYRHKKLVNWDPILKTAISNIEVIHRETQSKMYYFKYLSEDQSVSLVVATTRPETMFGDVCLVMNPNDKRVNEVKGKKFYNPANNELLPIIFDEYVDLEFGTGVMKCTPAHDFNDYELGKKHHLEIINVMNDDATMNEKAGEFAGLDRFVCREQVLKKIEQQGLLVKVEEVTNQVGYSERTNTIVEPYLSWQWFVKMKELANDVIALQSSSDEVIFHPKRFNQTLLTWLNNIEDWCISRQLWWGHQIPIWYHKNTDEIHCSIDGPTDPENWVRDEDVLDTWFSSGLWPFATLGWPNSELMKIFYPTNVLVTGYDIIFFWVSRMMMFAKHFTNQRPFNNVLIHGLIRDQYGKKMSKSLGNGIDPMDVIDEYGADTLRIFLTSTASLGEDLKFSHEKLRANWNFLNKLWNGSKYILDLDVDSNLTSNDLTNLTLFDKWILSKFNNLVREVKKDFEAFNFVVSTKKIIEFVWDDFFNIYLEYTKQDVKNNATTTKKVLVYLLKQILIILHPQCPFITETIYQEINSSKSILEETYPNEIKFEVTEQEINATNELVKLLEFVKKFRTDNGLSFKTNVVANLNSINNNSISNFDFYQTYLTTQNVTITTDPITNGLTQLTETFEIKFAPIQEDKNVIIAQLEKQFENIQFEIDRATNILNNQDFISKAPEQKVQLEKNKLTNYQQQLEIIKDKLTKLK